MKSYILKFLVAVAALFVADTSAHAQGALRPGDSVEIRISGVPTNEIHQFNSLYTVDDNGKLNIPYIKLVQAAGLSPNQVQRTIEDRLRSEGIFTQPTIIINVMNNQRFVTVGGAVRNPSRVPYTADLTLLASVNAAGGFNDFANKRKVRLMRDGKAILWDCIELMKDPSKDPQLKPGDQVEVPTSIF